MSYLQDAIRQLLRTIFDIRDGELRRAVLMQAVIFLLISTLLIVKPTVNGLFLSRFGVEKLPHAFLLVAVAAAIVSAVYSRLLFSISLHRIMRGTLWYSVLSLLAFGCFLLFGVMEELVLFLFYIWVAIFALLSTSQFWVLANLVFNAREAKRLFGFIGAGAIAGGIFGGYLTSLLARFMRVEFLLFVSALLLLICLPVLQKVWRENLTAAQPHFQHQKQLPRLTESPVRLILQSRHLTYIAGIVGISVMVAKLVDYQFGGVAAAAIGEPDRLTAFFGFWFSTFNLLSLLLQLFFTRRVVGVGPSLFFLPSAIAFAAGILVFSPAWLPAAVFLKMSDGSLKQSINKAAMELIILPIPAAIKNQTKTFIDVFVDSAATGISGLVLIFLIKGLELPVYAVSLLILALIGGWLLLAVKVRREYIHSFKLKIEDAGGEEAAERKIVDLSDEAVVKGLTGVLENGAEKQVLYVLELIRDFRSDQFFEPVTRLLSHPASTIRAAAIAALQTCTKRPVPEKIEPLVNDPSLRVKIAAFEYLLDFVPGRQSALMNEYLAHPNYQVRGAALVTLARDTSDNPSLKLAFGLGGRIMELLQQQAASSDPDRQRFEKLTALKAIGYANLPELHEQIFPFFSDEDPAVVTEAIRSAGHTLSPIFVSQLTRFLVLPAFREEAAEALACYGIAIIPELRKLVNSPDCPLEIIRMFPLVGKKVNSQWSVNFLLELFDHEDTVLQENALHALNFLHNQHAYLKVDNKKIVGRILQEARLYQETLPLLYMQMNRWEEQSPGAVPAGGEELLEARRGLARLLEQRLDRSLERIFRLLGLKYPSEDIVAAYKSLRSQKEDLRINALEFLDNLLEPNLKKMLMPIVETAALESVTEETISTLHLKIPEEYECFRMLLRGKDVRIKLAVLYLIAQLGDAQYLPLVYERINSDGEKVREYARNVLREFDKNPD
jgi:AAA family ATP:ADP antiporter